MRFESWRLVDAIYSKVLFFVMEIFRALPYKIAEINLACTVFNLEERVHD